MFVHQIIPELVARHGYLQPHKDGNFQISKKLRDHQLQAAKNDQIVSLGLGSKFELYEGKMRELLADVSLFNPMLFAVNLRKPLDNELDVNGIFVEYKRDTITNSSYAQGASASTDLLTSSSNVLKIILEVSHEELRDVFNPHKQLLDTHPDNNQVTNYRLGEALKNLAHHLKITISELRDILNQSQRVMVDSIQRLD